jgi:Recombinase
LLLASCPIMARGDNFPAIAAKGRRVAAERRTAAACQRAAAVAPLVRDLRAEGLSLRRIARILTARGILTAQGGPWSGVQVARVLARVPNP